MSIELTPQNIVELFDGIETIASVGASTTESTPAHEVPAYLQRHGYRLIPVNPTTEHVLGEPAYDSLDDVEEEIDVVQVFRPAEEAPDIARSAVARGARILWLQLGIRSDDAERIAEEAGLIVVADGCMRQVHKKYVMLREE